ncbi:MAG: LysR family transcriptional regulator [Clostridia bacterium]|nr:LysR family transcriptional regulator [Clostridia bacterium]NCC75610.1 LysR family transcriptional regulator [Clostridia bacterium]
MNIITISLAISELEKLYGTKLFDRIGRRMYLTDAGQRLRFYA